MRILAGAAVMATLLVPVGAMSEERAQQAATPPAATTAPVPPPIRKDPAEVTGAVTPRKVGQESERVIDGRRCTDVLEHPDQHPHALWIRCRAP